jgi:hypothetical protein
MLTNCNEFHELLKRFEFGGGFSADSEWLKLTSDFQLKTVDLANHFFPATTNK